jgi:hypothetical protein
MSDQHTAAGLIEQGKAAFKAGDTQAAARVNSPAAHFAEPSFARAMRRAVAPASGN